MNKPLISVIVPVYNVELFLPYSLQCLLNQTYQNLEIILVNDGSTDNSGEICKKYESNDNRIKLLNQENQGVSATRNTGIDIATGEYISFIDPDDVISNDFYEILFNTLTKTHSDIAECESTQISESDLFKQNLKFDTSDTQNYVIVDRMGALNRIHNEDIHIIGKSLVVWNKLYKRELFNNIRFPVGKIYEDDFTTYKIFNEANQLVSINQVLYNYVQRKGSTMHKEFSLKRLDALDAFDEHVNFFSKLSDRQLFEKCLLRYQRILIKILEEVYDSKYDDKKTVVNILKNKFEEITTLLNEFDNDKNSVQNTEKSYSKEFYTNKFYSVLK